MALSESIKRLQFPVSRLRTGTPPRLSNKTIDYSQLEADPGDEKITWFSFLNSFKDYQMQQGKITCYLTRTNSKTHEIILSNYHQAPVLGENEFGYGIGPRYCPSIEKKLLTFTDKESHTIWLEPEGHNSDIVYPNGISTGLPYSVQEDFVRSIKGLENATIL